MLYTYLEFCLLLLAGLTTVSLYVVIPYLLLLLLPNIGAMLEHLPKESPAPTELPTKVTISRGEEAVLNLINTLTDKLQPNNQFEIIPDVVQVESALQLLLQAREKLPGSEYLRYLLKKALMKPITRAAYMQYVLMALDFLRDVRTTNIAHSFSSHHHHHHHHHHLDYPEKQQTTVKRFIKALKSFKSSVVEPDYIARSYQLRGFKLLRKDWRWKRIWLDYSPLLDPLCLKIEQLIKHNGSKAEVIVELGNMVKALKAQLSSLPPSPAATAAAAAAPVVVVKTRNVERAMMSKVL